MCFTTLRRATTLVGVVPHGLILVMCLSLTSFAFADEAYQVGDQLPKLELPDQHGRSGSIDETTRCVLLVRDKFASEVLKEAFAGMDPGVLAERHVAYVTDISELSLMAANLFVVPGMRLKEYSILLDRKPRKTGRYPGRGGQVTVLFLEALRIERIVFAAAGEEVAALLDLPRVQQQGEL